MKWGIITDTRSSMFDLLYITVSLFPRLEIVPLSPKKDLIFNNKFRSLECNSIEKNALTYMSYFEEDFL